MTEDNGHNGRTEDDLILKKKTWMLMALESYISHWGGRSCTVSYLIWWVRIHYKPKSYESHEPHLWHNGHHQSSARFSSTTLTQPHPRLTGNRSDGGPDPPTSVHRGQTHRLLQWQPVTSRWWHAQVEPSNYNKCMEEHQQLIMISGSTSRSMSLDWSQSCAFLC